MRNITESLMLYITLAGFLVAGLIVLTAVCIIRLRKK